MNINDPKYTQYALTQEMYQSAEVIRRFDQTQVRDVMPKLQSIDSVLIAGEGSSRIFPGKNFIYHALQSNLDKACHTEGCLQAMEYDLKNKLVFGVSNSGKTKEVIQLFKKLKAEGHQKLFGVACNQKSMLEEVSDQFSFLGCGKEDAVAATKSVMNQALFFDVLLKELLGEDLPSLDELATAITKTLDQTIAQDIVQKLSEADTVYFCGRDNGVAEELALKTNEIIRKKSAFLPGTLVLHGIEEVITPKDVLVLVSPYKGELEKTEQIYTQGIGSNVISISSFETPFLDIPMVSSDPFYNGYLELATGWNLLAETGIHMGINLDKPMRARKVGNEFF